MGSVITGTTPYNVFGNTAISYDYHPALIPTSDLEPTGMWRYRKLLPIGDGPIRFPLPVGGTPLIASQALRTAVGMPNLWLKDETTGPSASNKDRATALVLEIGLREGASAVTVASTGNAGVATAIAAQAAGLTAVIFTPADCHLAKVAMMRAAGAHVFRVTAGYRAAFEMSRTVAGRMGWLDRNTGLNPVTLEGKKTVAFEIWEQLGQVVPDVVVAPVGDGPTLVGLAKGFHELRACGATSRFPRIIGVQAAGCQPLVRQWQGQPRQAHSPVETIADGIKVPEPAIGDWAVQEVTAGAGAFVAVTDEELRSAVLLLEREGGVASEPAGAAALAGLRRALLGALVESVETAVVLVTGAPFRRDDFDCPAGRDVQISGDVREFAESWQAMPEVHPDHRTS